MDSTIKEYSEKIKKILANPQVVDKIFADMNAQNLPLHTPCLKLEVVGNEEAYELEIEDVRSVFNVFGEVHQVSVIPYGMALVMYKEIISAYLAQKILDGKNLLPFGANIKDNIPINQKQNGINKQTKIQEEDEEEIKEDKVEEEEIKQLPTQIQGQTQQKQNNSKNKEIQKQQTLKKQTQSTNQNAQNQNSSNQNKSPSNNSAYQNQKQEYQVKNSSNQNQTEENGTGSRPSAKFTCRYEIQIANDKDFQVARRIIGPRVSFLFQGSNMKKVVDMCVRDMPTHYQAQDVIKLRLRGKGSGFKEGPNQQESNEPLHLCVSSKYHEKYMLACEQCELLIQQVYEDYKVYCKQKGLEVPNLQLKKQQNPNQTTQQQTSYLKNYEIGNNPDDQEIQAWIEARNEARRRCDFEEADRIRDMLKQKNIVLIDEKGARGKCITTWKIENR